ncbi:MAG TPA: gliding motility-associated C-terminal domain-containing protein [Saprospiraceae bacterium]|nr:gliding motility-associated C-terminal domain-containing protein [Saprospiraceae bacterium]HPQ21065.1 gliding motility-associated C-terminal domain-containing protein [Saprospiraceae bacterium]
MKFKYYIVLVFIFLGLQLNSQNFTFDQCQYAFPLGQVTSYCSGEFEFNNKGATLSPEGLPFCWFGTPKHDVWFAFVPTQPTVYVSLKSRPGGSNGVLANPSIAVYSGNCGNLTEEGCNSEGTGNGFTELIVPNVNIGQVYYLRVDSRLDNTGDFQICIEAFVPRPSPESDCKDAVVLCDKSPFQVENLDNVGDVLNELTGTCIGPGNSGEKASVWYVWTCDQSGTLTFTIAPNNFADDEEDIDFVVYEFPGGLNDCQNRKSLRCMLSGETSTNTPAQNAPCFGPTGLMEGDTDISEDPGCQPGNNNFAAPINMESGKSYGIIINNFSQSGYGFSIEFGGTGTFLGPKADFDIESIGQIECDKIINFTNLSSSETDPIISTSWSFGNGANPGTANGGNQHNVEYNSFGDKIAAITIESSRGCLVTTTKEFYVEPCCKDTSTLDLTAESFDVDCYQNSTGALLVTGISGAPQYMYSFNGNDFTNIPYLGDLAAGNYSVTIQDQKGCEAERSFQVDEPPPVEVNAGADQSGDLGCPYQLYGSYFSSKPLDTLYWSPSDGVEDINDPNTTVYPPGNFTYTLTVVDTSGCTQSDEISFDLNIQKIVEWPNIFSPNNDGINDLFFLSFGNGVDDIRCKPPVEYVDKFMIFDRWGSLVFLEQNIDINNRSIGWNGTRNGTKVETGVYTWVAYVKFIDREEPYEYHGDITVVR